MSPNTITAFRTSHSQRMQMTTPTIQRWHSTLWTTQSISNCLRSFTSAPKLSASHKKVSCFHTKVVSITHKGQLLLNQSCQHHKKWSVASALKLLASCKKVSCFCTKVVSIMQKRSVASAPKLVASAPKLSASHKKVCCFPTQVVSITQKGQLLLHESCHHNAKRSVASNSAPLTLLTTCLLQYRSHSNWVRQVASTLKLSVSCKKGQWCPKLSASCKIMVSCFHTKVVSITQKGQFEAVGIAHTPGRLLPHQSCQQCAERSVWSCQHRSHTR